MHATPAPQPVAIPARAPTLFLLGVMSKLADFAFSRLMVFGGALRDPYMGRPELINDIDICANWASIVRREDVSEERFKKIITTHIARIPGVADVTFYHTDNDCDWCRSLVLFTYKGEKVSLFENCSQAPFDTRLMEIGDAPLNTVGMNICGGVRAHPLFMDHAENKIYAPYPPKDCWESMAINARYTYLRAKYPGLRFEPL